MSDIELSEPELPENEGKAVSAFEEVESDVDIKEFDPTDVVRIEEDLRVVWAGVEKCCKQERIDKEATDRWKAWVNQKKAENPNLIPLRNGHGRGFNFRCGPVVEWPGPRKCTGSQTITCYIEFRKPEPELPRTGPIAPYIIQYVAIRETEWISHPADGSPERGYISKGQVVYFAEEPGDQEWQRAKIDYEGIHFIQPYHFRQGSG